MLIFAGAAYSQLNDVEMEATKITFSPDFIFFVPNAVVDLNTKESIENVTFGFSSKYDFLNNQFHADIITKYDFGNKFAGLDLGDKVDFDQIYSNNTYFQRVKYIKPFFGYNFAKFLSVQTAIDFQNTLTSLPDLSVDIDKGRNTLSSVVLGYNSIDKTQPILKGQTAEATLAGAFKDFDSDYDYTRGELYFLDIFQPFGVQFVEFTLKTGFPLSTDKRPLSDTYFAGGYELMRGYSYNEFQGNMLKYMQIMYHFPLIYKFDLGQQKFQLEMLTFDVFSEFAQIGEQKDFADFDSIKTSASVGTSYNMILFSRLKAKFSVYLSQAVESNRLPVLYFSLATYSYSPKPK